MMPNMPSGMSPQPMIFMQPLQNLLNGVVHDFKSDYWSADSNSDADTRLEKLVRDSIKYGYERRDPTIMFSLHELDAMDGSLSGVENPNSEFYTNTVNKVLNAENSDLLKLTGEVSPVMIITRMMAHLENCLVNMAKGELAEQGIFLKRYSEVEPPKALPAPEQVVE